MESLDSGEITEFTRGLPTLGNAYAEKEEGLPEILNTSKFVSAHSTCQQKCLFEIIS